MFSFRFAFTSGRERTAYTPPFLLTHQQHFGAKSFWLGAKALSGLEVQRLLHISHLFGAVYEGRELCGAEHEGAKRGVGDVWNVLDGHDG